jgi:PBP1b-binding outer membrane lipoprotein LpoB
MKKTALVMAAIFALFVSGCSKKQEPVIEKEKVEVNKTTENPVEKPAEKQAVKAEDTKQVKEVTKTIKRTNVTINSYSECPSFKNNDYKTIPYE